MWIYFALFIGSLAIDLIPMIGPPVWTLMVFMLVRFDLNPWLVLVAGVPGSVLGRYGLSLYVPKLFLNFITQAKSDELRFAGSRLNGGLRQSWLFVLLYSLLPLSTTALFSAAGLARIRPSHILPPFFVGKFISDAAMVFAGRYAIHNSSDLLYGMFSWSGAASVAIGFMLLGAFLFVDWRAFLEKGRLRFDAHIWKSHVPQSPE